MILQTLYQNCVKHDVEFFNEFYALDICLTENEDGEQVATGVVAYELATGEIHVFHAKSIVFATGGSGRMYKTTSNAHTLTGDGMGIIFRKGLPPRGHGVPPVPSDGPGRPRHPHLGGRAR